MNRKQPVRRMLMLFAALAMLVSIALPSGSFCYAEEPSSPTPSPAVQATQSPSASTPEPTAAPAATPTPTPTELPSPTPPPASAFLCGHMHDSVCGFGEDSSCGHICRILSFNGNIPGQPMYSLTAQAGDDLSALLPNTLTGTLACADAPMEIPVYWHCGNYTGEAGTYIFRSMLADSCCAYAPLASEPDETALPFAEITVAAPVPAYAVRTVSDEGNTVSVTGPMPEDAGLAVRPLTGEELAAYVTGSENVVFAYDIKLMLPGQDGEVEYQPAPENPVTVTVIPPSPIEARRGVAVVHISQDADTGETSAHTVANVTPAQDGAVTFPAEGFSIYIGTTTPAVQSPTPDMYWNGTNFYTDSACSSANIVTNSLGAAYTRLPALLADIDGDATIYMQAAYAVSGTESIGSASHAVTLTRHSSYTTGALITVSAGGSLTLANISIDGADISAGASLISSSGTLTINDGTLLQNNVTTGNGGAISSSGALNISGGTISGNTANAFGGGVYVSSTAAVFTMTGGSITGNTATADNGGGVYVLVGTFTMQNGTITGNMTDKSGGGVFASNEAALFVMEGGSITGNSAGNWGGGLAANAGELRVSGGSISGNHADANSDGIGVYGSAGVINALVLSGLPQISDGVYFANAARRIAVVDDSAAPFAPAVPIPLTTAVTAQGTVAAAYYSAYTDVNTNTPRPTTAEDASDFAMTDTSLTLAPGTADQATLVIDLAVVRISYDALELPSTLTAVLAGVVAASYQWQSSDDGSAWSDVTGANSDTYSTAVQDVGKRLRAVVTDVDGNSFASAPVTVLAPQLSVAVPTSALVTVNAAGACSVPAGEISNSSAVPVYVTEVSLAWLTESAGADADELFLDYTLVTAKLTLSGTEYSFSGPAPSQQHPTETNGMIAAKTGDTPGTLTLPWAFALGAGNRINLLPAMGEEVLVARITYTIDYLPLTP